MYLSICGSILSWNCVIEIFFNFQNFGQIWSFPSIFRQFIDIVNNSQVVFTFLRICSRLIGQFEFAAFSCSCCCYIRDSNISEATLENLFLNSFYSVYSHESHFEYRIASWIHWALKIGRLMAKIPPDCDQSSVFRNQKWQITNINIK